jgi:hypothetical protein
VPVTQSRLGRQTARGSKVQRPSCHAKSTNPFRSYSNVQHSKILALLLVYPTQMLRSLQCFSQDMPECRQWKSHVLVRPRRGPASPPLRLFFSGNPAKGDLWLSSPAHKWASSLELHEARFAWPIAKRPNAAKQDQDRRPTERSSPAQRTGSPIERIGIPSSVHFLIWARFGRQCVLSYKIVCRPFPVIDARSGLCVNARHRFPGRKCDSVRPRFIHDYAER